MTRFFASPGVRSSYTNECALLFDTKGRRCHSLNGVAARIWVMIEHQPMGVSFEAILDALQTDLKATREELDHTVRDCVAQLQLAGLVAGKMAGDNEFYNNTMLSLSRGSARTHPDAQQGESKVEEQRFVETLETLESLVNRILPRGTGDGVDWRVSMLKSAIDSAPGKVIESLGHVCSQLQLSLSDRQARRLFREAEGMSMKDYTRKQRLVLAAKQLQDTNEAVKVIATNAGYRTYDGFWKAFHNMFQLTPVEFRRFWQRRAVAV